MRITFVLPTANMCGGIRVVAIYAKALAERGHRVVLVSPPAPPVPLSRKVKDLMMGRGWTRSAPPPSHFDGMGLDHRVLESYRPIGDDDLPEADVVIATWWETAEWVSRLAPRKGKKAYFIQHHEIHPYLPVERCRATYRMPLRKIVIARWLADVMRDEYDDDDVDLVPNSVDHDLFFAPQRGRQPVPTIGFLYSCSSYKGVDVTLAAIEKLRALHPDLRVISFGSAQPDWSAATAASIEFHFSPRQAELRGLYAQCDLWMTASRSEGFNLPAMEAMACRTPVVSTRAGWPMEAIVDGKNGFLTEVDDVDALAVAATRILSLGDADWRALSDNAFATVKDSSWARSCDLFEQALIRLSSKAGDAQGAKSSSSIVHS